jgi:hypothetical protein
MYMIFHDCTDMHNMVVDRNSSLKIYQKDIFKCLHVLMVRSAMHMHISVKDQDNEELGVDQFYRS